MNATQEDTTEASSPQATTVVKDITATKSKPPPLLAINRLLDNNRKWAERMKLKDANFFATLAEQQRPDLLWIGCSDSRVPANQIIDLPPGRVFVHRNVANIFLHCDFNALTVSMSLKSRW
jgi:carbonic anhydrase